MGEIQSTDVRRIAFLHQCEELCHLCRRGDVPVKMDADFGWRHVVQHGVGFIYEPCAAGDVRDRMEGG